MGSIPPPSVPRIRVRAHFPGFEKEKNDKNPFSLSSRLMKLKDWVLQNVELVRIWRYICLAMLIWALERVHWNVLMHSISYVYLTLVQRPERVRRALHLGRRRKMEEEEKKKELLIRIWDRLEKKDGTENSLQGKMKIENSALLYSSACADLLVPKYVFRSISAWQPENPCKNCGIF